MWFKFHVTLLLLVISIKHLNRLLRWSPGFTFYLTFLNPFKSHKILAFLWMFVYSLWIFGNLLKSLEISWNHLNYIQIFSNFPSLEITSNYSKQLESWNLSKSCEIPLSYRCAKKTRNSKFERVVPSFLGFESSRAQASKKLESCKFSKYFVSKMSIFFCIFTPNLQPKKPLSSISKYKS